MIEGIIKGEPPIVPSARVSPPLKKRKSENGFATWVKQQKLQQAPKYGDDDDDNDDDDDQDDEYDDDDGDDVDPFEVSMNRGTRKAPGGTGYAGAQVEDVSISSFHF